MHTARIAQRHAVADEREQHLDAGVHGLHQRQRRQVEQLRHLPAQLDGGDHDLRVEPLGKRTVQRTADELDLRRQRVELGNQRAAPVTGRSERVLTDRDAQQAAHDPVRRPAETISGCSASANCATPSS